MRTHLFRLILAVLLGSAALAGCGDDDGSNEASANGDAPTDDETADDETAAGDGGSGSTSDDGAWPPEDAFGSGQAGEVTVDDVSYGIDATRLCDLSDYDEGSGRVREFEVQGIGAEDPDDEFSEPVEVSVFTGTIDNPDRDRQGIRWDGPEGLFEGEATGGDDSWMVVSDQLDGPPLEIDDDRITGELVLRSSMGREPVEVTVDIANPGGDPVSCH